MNDKIENLSCHPVTLARVLLCRGSLQTDRLTLFCFCSAVFGQASERASEQTWVSPPSTSPVAWLLKNCTPLSSSSSPSSLHSLYAFMLMTNCLPSFLQLETPSRPPSPYHPPSLSFSMYSVCLIEDEIEMVDIVDMGIDWAMMLVNQLSNCPQASQIQILKSNLNLDSTRQENDALYVD